MLPGQSCRTSRSTRLRRQRLVVRREAVRRAVVPQEALGEERDVAGPLAQRRQPDQERVDAIVEILAEAAFAHEVLERTVGGADQAEVGLDRSRPAEALEASLLQDAQQLGLPHRRHVGDLVEEQRAAVGQLDAPRLGAGGAGEGALLVAEHLRLEQRVGQRGAVERLHVAPAPRPELVDHARRHFLARSGRAEDQDGNLRLRGGADRLEDDQHLLVAAHQVAEVLRRRRRLLDAGAHRTLQQRVDERAPAAAGLGLEPALATPHQAGFDEIVEAVLDILRQPREVLRQRVEREARVGPLVQMAQQRRPEGRLDEGVEAIRAVDEKAWIVAAAIADARMVSRHAWARRGSPFRTESCRRRRTSRTVLPKSGLLSQNLSCAART